MRYEKALKSDFLLTSLFSPMQYGGRNIEKFQNFFESFSESSENFKVFNWSEMDFALCQSTQKGFFVHLKIFSDEVYYKT